MPNESSNINISNCFACTVTNQRDNNEDYQSVFLLPYAGNAPPITVLAVADGMGGHEHGEDVSRQAVLKIREFLYESVEHLSRHATFNPEDLKKLLFKAIQNTNHLVLRMVAVNGWKQAGSTIVVAAVWGNRVIATNLGDSPLFHYVARQRKVIRVSQDHSVPGILVQANLISEEMARYHERRGQLEYFLGADTLPPTEFVYERKLESGDLLLLCSDGISGLLRPEQIEAILAAPETGLPEKANQLIEAARKLGETDNQTLILWRYDRPVEMIHSLSQNERAMTSDGYQLSSTSSIASACSNEQPTVIQSSSSLRSFSNSTRTLLVRPTKRAKKNFGKQSLVILLAGLGIFAVGYLLFTLFFHFFHLVMGEMGAVNQQPTPSISQPQSPSPSQPTPLIAPEISVPKSAPYQNEAGLTIEDFINEGKVLITKNLEGATMQWTIAETKGQTVCSANVPQEFENQQQILAVTPRQGPMFKSLLTLGENNCMRQWLYFQNSWNPLDGFKKMLQTLLRKG